MATADTAIIERRRSTWNTVDISVARCAACERSVRNDDDHQDASFQDADGLWLHYRCAA